MPTFLKSSQVIRLLGISYYRLVSTLRSGKMEPPARDFSGDFIWLEADIERLRAALAVDRRRRTFEPALAAK
jgi:hypothetical protein